MGDQPISRTIHTQDSTTQKKAGIHSCLGRDSNVVSKSSTDQDHAITATGENFFCTYASNWAPRREDALGEWKYSSTHS
jgi:hypothetical protein